MKKRFLAIFTKKLISILIILSVFTVCITGSSLADEFTLHSGVKFGMTLEEITQIEENAGFETTLNEEKTQLEITGKIASVENSRIDYAFINNKMFQASYALGRDSINRGVEGYSIIQESLESKYGEPTGLPNNFHSSEFLGVLSSISPDDFLQEQGDVEISNEWLIRTDNGYVVIEHIKFYYKFTKLFLDSGMRDRYPEGRTYNEKILYHFYDFNDPEINDALNNAIENSQQLQNDL